MERASWKAIIFSHLYQSILLVLAHCVTYLFIDASREPDEGNKGDDSGDDEFPNEEQEVGDLVKNCHPYLGRQLSKVILKFSAGCSPYFWISNQKPALRTDRNWFLERRSKCRHSWNIWWTSNLSFKKRPVDELHKLFQAPETAFTDAQDCLKQSNTDNTQVLHKCTQVTP